MLTLERPFAAIVPAGQLCTKASWDDICTPPKPYLQTQESKRKGSPVILQSRAKSCLPGSVANEEEDDACGRSLNSVPPAKGT